MPRMVMYFNEILRERFVANVDQFKRELRRFEDYINQRTQQKIVHGQTPSVPKTKFISLVEVRKSIETHCKLVFGDDLVESLHTLLSSHDNTIYMHLCLVEDASGGNILKRIYQCNQGQVQQAISRGESVLDSVDRDAIVQSQQNKKSLSSQQAHNPRP